MYLFDRQMRLPYLIASATLLSAIGSAQVQTFQLDGTVATANTRSILGQNLSPSEVQQGIPVGSDFSFTFSYNQSQPIHDQYLAVTEYDAPFALSGKLGDRTFTGTASLIMLNDNLPGEGDDQFYLFISELVYGNSTEYSPQVITENNPFPGSDYYLNRFEIKLTDSTGTAFSGGALPSTLSFSSFDSTSFNVSYHDRNSVSDESDDVSTEFSGAFNSVRQINAVPEPATMAALALGASALLRRRRKA